VIGQNESTHRASNILHAKQSAQAQQEEQEQKQKQEQQQTAAHVPSTLAT